MSYELEMGLKDRPDRESIISSKPAARDELDSLQAAKRQAEIKLQMFKKRYEEEIASFNEARVEQIFKNSGAREYFERLKDRVKIKDDIIKNLKEELEFKLRELSDLHDRCKDAESKSQEYLKAWKDAQMARERLETERKSHSIRERQQAALNQSFNPSSASSLIDHSSVPPPPPVEVPSIEEIIRMRPSPQSSNPFLGLSSSSIPPPPDIEVPLDEILQSTGLSKSNGVSKICDDMNFQAESNTDVPRKSVAVSMNSNDRPLDCVSKASADSNREDIHEIASSTTQDGFSKLSLDRKAFEQEKGQFLCYAYLSIDLESSQDTLGDITELVDAEQSRSPSRAFQGWISLNNKTEPFEKGDYHISLIRGHRTIHYHQIKPLVAAVEELCRNLRPCNLCLDKLKLFNNFERTKQFLALATCNNEPREFWSLKQAMRELVDRFAERGTDEDETDDTVPHCSIMYRHAQQVEEETGADLLEIEHLCNENLDDCLCLVLVETVHLKIGKEVYSFNLSIRD